MSDSIRVVCRLRPLNKIEIANNGQECVTYTDKQINIAVGGEDNKYSFAFDKIFGPSTQQVMVYREVALPVIKSVVSGFNGTIFAYGQTGGGKTWTMEGPNHHDTQFKGLIPRTIQGLFQSIAQCDESLEFVVKSSYIQIYNQKLFDLLDPSKARLQIKQDKQRGVFIQNCTEISVSSSDQMLKTMDSGSQNRKVAFTGMNQRSSRSHSLFIIHLYQKNLKKDSTKESKLYFVDLAGSQKVSKTGVMGQQLQQAKNINKSLSALGNVINALTSQKKQHVPYRDSKLTRILQQSLGGNSRTTLIINCSMCTYNDKQTLSTLRFGYRAKSIKNKPKVNQQKSVKELLILLQSANKTILQLKTQLKMPLSSIPSQAQPQVPVLSQKDAEIAQLKQQLENHKKQQQQRVKQLQTRIKQLILEVTKEKEDKNLYENKWANIFSKLASFLQKVSKFANRSYVDLEFCLNNVIINAEKQLQQMFETSADTVQNTLNNLNQFQEFYKMQLLPILNQISAQQQEQEEQLKINMLTPDKRRNKIALSQPILFNNQYKPQNEQQKSVSKEDSITNMSCIISNLDRPGEENGSDKISQSESSEIQTMLQSLQTKQSHRIALEEMSNSIKQLKKENEELGKKIQSLIQERESFCVKIQQKYEDKLMELQERVHQYKNIMYQKDIELTKYFEDTEKLKKSLTQQKIVGQRFKKIIESNSNMKSYYQMQQKMRSMASERQKIFNQLYSIRQQLDQAEITIKQKQQHIESLKEVMKQLNQNMYSQPLSQQQITKNYNTQVFGTETPNVVQIIKGGGASNKDKDKEKEKDKEVKKSSLRKKTLGSGQAAGGIGDAKRESKQGKQSREVKDMKQYIPFFKTFFN